MGMSKKDFIALADAIKEHNRNVLFADFGNIHLDTLANFCKQQNPAFKRERWIAYINGECGGKI